MLNIETFTCNMLQENCYVVSDETNECVIIDCGAYYEAEKLAIEKYISENNLKPVHLIATHGHLDHNFGSPFIAKTYGLPLEIDSSDVAHIKGADKQAAYFGISLTEPLDMEIKTFTMGSHITFGSHDIEVEHLYKLIHKAADDGVSIIYISHKLDELFEVADRVVVVRDGCVTGEIAIEDATHDMLVSRMVGRRLDDMYPKVGAQAGDAILEVEHLSSKWLRDVSFTARRGEIFGIYGLMGSGHQAIGSAIFGQDLLQGGTIRVSGKEVHIRSPKDGIAHGIAYVPAERKTEGLVLNQSVAVNAASAYYAKERKLLTNRKKDEDIAARWIKNLEIKTPGSQTIVESLSGGNQQKVVLAKWLELNPDILILNEPTRGIDVGAKAEIYRILDQQCQEGKCVIIITSEMPELLAMSDRIMVMFEGRVSGTLTRNEATQENVVRYAIGGN